jgi:hypothetical protein
MTQHVPRLSFSLDPLIAEAKRRTRRRRWLSLLVVVAVAAAVTAALELRSGPGSGLAAVGSRPVVHIVIESPPSVATANLRTGHHTGGASREEMWLNRQTGRERITEIENGHLVADQVWTNHGAPTTEAAAVDHVYVSLVDNFRAALKSGEARLVGHGTFGGHDIDWLGLRQLPVPPWRHGQPWPQTAKTDIGVDSHTFRPVLLRFGSDRGTRGGYYAHVLEAGAIPNRAGDFKRRGPARPRPAVGRLATGYAFGSPDHATGSTIVRAPWLTAGATVAGLKLRALVPFTIRRSKHRFKYGARTPRAKQGLELVYGPSASKAGPTVPTRINVYGKGPRGETRFTTIYEVPRAARVFPWSGVPAGSLRIQSGLTTVGRRIVRTLRVGYLQKDGVFITIRTPQSERTAVQIARSLRRG